MSNRIQSPSCRGCHAPRHGVTSQSSCPRPRALLPPSLQAGGQAEAGWCCWFPSACFLVAMATHQQLHQELHHQLSESQWQEACATGGVCPWSLWLGLCVLAMVSCSPVAGQRHTSLPKASLAARHRCRSWLLVLLTAGNKMSS